MYLLPHHLTRYSPMTLLITVLMSSRQLTKCPRCALNAVTVRWEHLKRCWQYRWACLSHREPRGQRQRKKKCSCTQELNIPRSQKAGLCTPIKPRSTWFLLSLKTLLMRTTEGLFNKSIICFLLRYRWLARLIKFGRNQPHNLSDTPQSWCWWWLFPTAG